MKNKRKLLMIFTIVLMLVSMAGVGAYYWYENANYISTEDAKVSADLVKVTPEISSKLLELNIEEGQAVEKGQILGRQDMSNLQDSNIDTSLIKSPITGVVIKKQGTVGEFASTGQTLAMIVNPKELYITANIEETKLERLKLGGRVDISIDKYIDKKFTGKIDNIGEASAATFSMLPSSTGGNFTKVVQKVPVKIKLDKYNNSKLIPGLNAVVKIHLK